MKTLEEKRAYHAAWRAKNKDKIRRHYEKQKATNPEGLKRSQQKWLAKNPGYMKAASRRSYERNRERVLEKSRNRPKDLNAFYARMYQVRQQRAAPPWLTKDHKKQIRAFYTEARRLTEETGEMHCVDHVVPLKGKTVCGLHVPWNLQVLTLVENSRKHNGLPE